MSYLEETTMRKQQFILGWLCTLLPFVAIGFGLIGAITGCNYPYWWYSISATFYANSNVIMIGLLFTTAIYFWAYRGYDKWDNIITRICSVCSFGIICFPCKIPALNNFDLVGILCIPSIISEKIHSVMALALYLSFMLMMLRFTKTDKTKEMTSAKKIRNIFYITFVVIMMCCAILISLKIFLKWPGYVVIILETIAQMCFGLSWLIKSEAFKLLNDK